jgi:hypothetical protein
MVDYRDTSRERKLVEYGSIGYRLKLQKIRQKTEIDYIREERKAWHDSHPSYHEKWRQEHPEYSKKKSKQWHRKHPNYAKEYSRKWREEHQGYYTNYRKRKHRSLRKYWREYKRKVRVKNSQRSTD